MRRMRNNNLKIGIAGSSYRPKIPNTSLITYFVEAWVEY